MEYQVLVRVDHSHTHLLTFFESLSTPVILETLSKKLHLPSNILHLHTPLPSPTTPPSISSSSSSIHVYHLSAFTKIPIQGGKGGFGTLLKGQSKQAAAKTTTDFGACRDLSGRRLRHVNDEIQLRKWKAYQQQLHELATATSSTITGTDRESENTIKRQRLLEIEMERIRTESGLHNWNLLVPTWSEISNQGGLQSSYQKKQERMIKKEMEEFWRELQRKEDVKRKEKQQKEEIIQSYIQPMMIEMEQKQQDSMQNAIRCGLLKQKSKKKQKTNDSTWTDDDIDNENVFVDKNEDEEQNRIYIHKKDKMKSPVQEGAIQQKTETIRSRKSEEEVTLLSIPNPSSSWTQHIMVLSGYVIMDDKTVIMGQEQQGQEEHPYEIHVQSKSNFATLCIPISWEASSSSIVGFYYEVIIATDDGVAQIGWADVNTSMMDTSPHRNIIEEMDVKMESKKFQPQNETGDGVGDDEYSYGYDGGRGLIFHQGLEQVYGLPMDDSTTSTSITTTTLWRPGDVIGCSYNKIKGEISFSINGVDQGVAFDVSALNGRTLCPAISLNQDVIMGMRVGAPFQYPPKDGLKGVFDSMALYPSS